MERTGFAGERVKHELGEVGWYVLEHVVGAVGAPAWLAALDEDTAVGVPSRLIGRYVEEEEFVEEG